MSAVVNVTVTPISFSLNQLFDGFVDESVNINRGIQIRGLAWDSRKVKPGDLFFACDGEIVHGKKYIQMAIEAGASAIALETDDLNEAIEISAKYGQFPIVPVSDLTNQLGNIAARFYGEPSKKMSLIGVTGTNGKTSITHLLAQCLSNENVPCGVIGTMGAGVWGQLEKVQNTTPGAVELQKWFYDLNESNAKYVAMEVSSHGLEQGRTVGCDFDIAVFTNLSQDHLDYHGDMETYGDVKLKLFTEYEPTQVVVNLDDPFSQIIIETLASNVSVIGVTIDSDNKKRSDIDVIYGKVDSFDDQGMKISIESPFGNGKFKTKLLGDFNVTNLLTVFACALQCGFSFDEICKKMESISAPSGRLERFGGGDKPLVIVDYAHTPDALEKVLVTLRKHTKGQLFVLVGCGGDRDKTKRPRMGAIAEAYADVVWLTNDNPRTESPDVIIEEILKGVKNPGDVFVEMDRVAAIHKIVDSAKKADVVLIAGKGHEDYQIIGDQRMDFSDRKIVAEILREAA